MNIQCIHLHTDNCKKIHIVNKINFPLTYGNLYFYPVPPFRGTQNKYNLSSV